MQLEVHGQVSLWFDGTSILWYPIARSGLVIPGDSDRSMNGIGHAAMRERGRTADLAMLSTGMRVRQTEIGAQGEPLSYFASNRASTNILFASISK